VELFSTIWWSPDLGGIHSGDHREDQLPRPAGWVRAHHSSYLPLPVPGVPGTREPRGPTPARTYTVDPLSTPSIRIPRFCVRCNSRYVTLIPVQTFISRSPHGAIRWCRTPPPRIPRWVPRFHLPMGEQVPPLGGGATAQHSLLPHPVGTTHLALPVVLPAITLPTVDSTGPSITDEFAAVVTRP